MWRRGGVVALNGLPPQVNRELTARLTDPDGGVSGASWQWQRRLGATGAWEAIGSVGGSSSYTPSSSDVGYYLRASVRYTDHHGPNKSAEGTTSAPVFGPPAATAMAGWGRIRVAWPAVVSATGYDVQGQGKPFDRGTWPTGWSSLATNIAGQQYAHQGVSPDSLYRYQVRSRMGATVSAWSALLPDAVGVQPGVGAPTGFRAAVEAGQVVLRWSGPDHASITQWQYRDATASGARTRGGWQDVAVSGSASGGWFAPVQDLTPGQAYRFQVRAVNGAGAGQPSVVSAAVRSGLARPLGGSVSVGAGPALAVAWSSVVSATGYEVQGQSKPFDGGSWPSAWTTQQRDGAQPYVHRGVDADRRYRYRVRARVGATVSAWSDTLPSASGVQPPPGPPTGLTATPGPRQVRLAWTGPAHASVTGWQYKRGHISGATIAWSGWRRISTAATTRSYTVAEPLTHGRSYVFQVRVGNAGGWSASARSDTVMLAVVPDTPGRVSLSTTTPQVGDALTATLVDPDVPIALQQWHWSYLVPSGASGASGANGDVVSPSASVSKTLRVSTVHLGLRILSRMSYTDAHGQQQAQSDTTSAVVGPPWAPQTVTATAGDGQVVLAWAAPLKLGGAAITSYQYRYKKKTGGSWSAWTGVGTATSQTVTSLTNGTAYSFEVRAVNSYGDGTVASAEATPQAPVCSLTGPTGPTVAENATASVGTYTVGGGCGSSSSWTLGGTDAGSFELQTVQGSSSSRTLHFRSAPNYEVKHSYQVSVGVSDGSLSASVAVAVSVTDANDPGRIDLSTTTPRAGQTLTATLSDDDGVEEPVYWTPSYVRASDAGGVTGQAAATEATQTWTLTIPRSRVGQKLRIQAHYTDSFGASTATSALTAAIGADNRPPCSPTAFTAVAGAAQVSLSWRAPTGTNCGTLTHYEYRYKQTSGSWPDNWTSAGTATSQTVEDLINSTAYTFEVRAANDYGQSASVSKSATPQQPNRAPVVSGSASVAGDENKTDSLGKYTGSDPDSDALSWSVSGTDAGSFELQASDSALSRNLHFVSAPDYETKHSYQVRVRVSDGSLADSVDVAVSVTDVNEVPVVSGSASVSGDENKTDSLGKYTASDPDGDTLTWSVSGTDAGSFELQASDSALSRNLHFVSKPNYETKSSYQVNVRVSDGSLAASLAVAVSVNNVEEEGSVSLTGGVPPQVGRAVVARLTDPDGQVTGASWQWQRRRVRRVRGKRLGRRCRASRVRRVRRRSRIPSNRAIRRYPAMWVGTCGRR